MAVVVYRATFSTQERETVHSFSQLSISVRCRIHACKAMGLL